MITLDNESVPKGGGRYAFDISGLSTDTKPTETFGNRGKIANGSTFFEMDTQKLFFYDEAHESWIGG